MISECYRPKLRFIDGRQNETSVDEMSVNETSVDKTSVGETSVDELSFGQMSQDPFETIGICV
jgi:hypothetical protein